MNRILLPLIIFFLTISFAQDTGARYLIITHDDYYNALLPLAEWKTKKGLKAKIKKLSEIGSDSTQIRDYVADAYNTWLIKPEYLLLVGANYQLPFPRRAGWEVCHTDNYYTNVTGDFRNEIIPGRFWVSDSLQAKTVVAKVMSYEKYPYMEDSMWFGRGVTIINLDADSLPGDSNYWNVTRYAHSLMINAGFNHIDSLVDAYGYDSIDVINSINNGCSYITYRGEAWGRWYHPFGDIYPTQMSNGYKLPIVVSATCATIDGIGYKWLRAGTPEEPKGIVGFYGTTTGLQGVSAERSALMRGTLTSIFCDSFSTLGQAAEAGRIEYFQLCGDSLDYDGWNCLGDPEMTVRTGTPKIIQVTHPSVCWTGICTVQVSVHCSSVPIESALVCIKAQRDSTIYHYGRTDNAGQIEFIDTLTVAIDSILVTVTARNTKPYCGQIEVHTGIKENQQLQKCNTPFLVVYPNPCRSTMYIEYGLGQYTREDVYLRIYDVTGRLVENIFSGRSKAGMNEFYVEPGKLSTGIYFIKVETDSYEETQKVILVN
ncbi:MAG: C25 family cysteine peptidase [bacterium]